MSVELTRSLAEYLTRAVAHVDAATTDEMGKLEKDEDLDADRQVQILEAVLLSIKVLFGADLENITQTMREPLNNIVVETQDYQRDEDRNLALQSLTEQGVLSMNPSKDHISLLIPTRRIVVALIEHLAKIRAVMRMINDQDMAATLTKAEEALSDTDVEVIGTDEPATASGSRDSIW
ncbi:MAG: hypothetical protein WCG83_06650 [Candidatus Peregrinibacteria bacterium]